tara:strand:+ start:514 stop:852 length:339 start_codon:yes stop_codon:yes gene_type:complete
MKITSKQLRQIIKEELEAVISETEGSIEDQLTHTLKMKIWGDIGGAYADQEKALTQAKAEVQQMIAAGADLEQELVKVKAALPSITKARKYKRSWHGDDGLNNLPHQSTWEE